MNRLTNIFLLTLLCGCQTPPMPLIDLSEAGWAERSGQALWQRPGAPRMAVDVHFAKRGEISWLQLSKGGLPLATVTLTANTWELNGSMFGRKARGRGDSPGRASPAQLARALGGRMGGHGWEAQWTSVAFILAHQHSGERWMVYLEP